MVTNRSNARHACLDWRHYKGEGRKIAGRRVKHGLGVVNGGARIWRKHSETRMHLQARVQTLT